MTKRPIEELSATEHFTLLYEIVGHDKTHPDIEAWRVIDNRPGKDNPGVALLHKHNCYEVELIGGFSNAMRPIITPTVKRTVPTFLSTILHKCIMWMGGFGKFFSRKMVR